MVNKNHMQLDVISQPINESSNPFGLRHDQSLGEAGELREAELVLIDGHITLDESLELPELMLSDVSWNELSEEVIPKGVQDTSSPIISYG